MSDRLDYLEQRDEHACDDGKHQRFLPEPDGQWHQQERTLQVEDEDEKSAEMIEDFSKKVPPEAHVWRQVVDALQGGRPRGTQGASVVGEWSSNRKNQDAKNQHANVVRSHQQSAVCAAEPLLHRRSVLSSARNRTDRQRARP
jgi:hypothetical protein